MYIGDKPVDRIEGVVVYFADGATKEYTKRQLKYVVTEEAKDLTQYRDLVLDTVLPEVKKALKADDIDKVSGDILTIMDEHDVTNAEIQSILSRARSELTVEYNEMLKKKAGKYIDQFELDKKKYEEVMTIVSDSYSQCLLTATAKAFGTYIEGEHVQNGIDSIRISDIKRLMQ